MDRKLRIGLVGAGMFGGNVHLRAYAELQRAGIAPYLGRIGLDHWARELAPIQFELTGLATRTPKSAGRAAREFKQLTGCAARTFSRNWRRRLGAGTIGSTISTS